MSVMNFFVNIYLVDWEVTKHKPPPIKDIPQTTNRDLCIKVFVTVADPGFLERGSDIPLHANF